MSKNNSVLGFIIGAAVGSVVTWFVSKQEYEKRMNEEIKSLRKLPEEENSVKESDKLVEEEHGGEDANASDKPNETDMMEYARRVKEEGYVRYETPTPTKEEKTAVERPYVITPEDFGEIDDYSKITLLMYADGVLADEDDNVVDDIEDTVGYESLNTFGKYEEDSVYVRNDAKKFDYEILLDQRRYRDIKRAKK